MIWNREWLAKFAFTLVVLSASYAVASAQASLSGRVVEVLDGRTAVIDARGTRFTVQLQFIETPESGQPYFVELRDHLKLLIYGKDIEFRPTTLMDGRSIGRLKCSGIDISMQMLRDGAAWLEGTSGSSSGETSEYERARAMAEAEKLGVWNIPSLKRPSVWRAEREAQLKREEAIKNRDRRPVVGVSEFQTANRAVTGGSAAANSGASPNELDAWTEVFSRASHEPNGLNTYTDPQGRFGTVYTSASFLELSSSRRRQKAEFRALYVYAGPSTGTGDSMYLLGFQSVSATDNFSARKSSLIVNVDGKKIALGAARGLKAEGLMGVQEVFYYRLSKANLTAIAGAKKVRISIDDLSADVSPEILGLIQMLVAST